MTSIWKNYGKKRRDWTVKPDDSLTVYVLYGCTLSIMDALHGKSVQVIEATSSILSFGDIRIYPAYRRVLKAGEEIHLNHGEYSMLYCLAKSPGRVFTRDQLYASAWDTEQHFGSNTVENTICRLRSKLEPDPRHPQYIKTVIGTGYKLVVPKK